jgi:tetratricopeptide (TPR) repeat protein
LYQEVLATKEKLFGREHPDTATTQHELARLYQAQGKYSEAEELYKQVLVTFEKMLGREHPDTIISIKSYASLLCEMNRPAEAEALEARIKPQKGNQP